MRCLPRRLVRGLAVVGCLLLPVHADPSANAHATGLTGAAPMNATARAPPSAAILLSGQVRSFRKISCSFYDNLVCPLHDAGYSVHVFILAEDVPKKPPKRQLEFLSKMPRLSNVHIRVTRRPPVPQECVKAVTGIYDRRVLHMYKAKYVPEFLAQLYYKWEVDQMRKRYETAAGLAFEWLVVARMDVVYTDPLPPLHALNASFVHVPRCQGFGGVNDKVAVCSPRGPSDAYFGLYPALCRDGDAQRLPWVVPVGLTSEMMYLWHLVRRRARLRLLDGFCMARQRSKSPVPKVDDLVDIWPRSQTEWYDVNRSSQWLVKGEKLWYDAHLSKAEIAEAVRVGDAKKKRALWLVKTCPRRKLLPVAK